MRAPRNSLPSSALYSRPPETPTRHCEQTSTGAFAEQRAAPSRANSPGLPARRAARVRVERDVDRLEHRVQRHRGPRGSTGTTQSRCGSSTRAGGDARGRPGWRCDARGAGDAPPRVGGLGLKSCAARTCGASAPLASLSSATVCASGSLFSPLSKTAAGTRPPRRRRPRGRRPGRAVVDHDVHSMGRSTRRPPCGPCSASRLPEDAAAVADAQHCTKRAPLTLPGAIVLAQPVLGSMRFTFVAIGRPSSRLPIVYSTCCPTSSGSREAESDEHVAAVLLLDEAMRAVRAGGGHARPRCAACSSTRPTRPRGGASRARRRRAGARSRPATRCAWIIAAAGSPGS